MNTITILNNKYCNLDPSSNKELSYQLWQLLSFKMQGVEFTQAYRNGWDGIVRLMDKKNNFPLGLLNKVENYLMNNNINYQLADKRLPIIPNKELDISANLKKLNLVPRDYQINSVELAIKHRKGIMRLCTGAGKTLIAALIAAKLNKPTIIYVVSLDLLDQFHKIFSDVFQQEIGYIGNGVCNIKKFNIASIWTVGKALGLKKDILDEDDYSEKELISIKDKINIQNLLQETELHIIDECHATTTNTIKEIYKRINPIYMFGLSATPYRDDGSDLLVNGILGEQIINISASELIKRNILAQPTIKFVNVSPVKINSRTYAAVYSEYIVENDLRNQLILKETKNLLDKGYQTLVLFKQIKHGKLLYEMFQKNGIDCEILHGSHKLEERQEIKQKLINGETKLILASVIYDLGIDVSSLSGLVLAGSGKSSIKTLQRIGRVIRGHPNKKYAAIVDFVDNARFVKQHSEKRFKIYSSEEGFIVKYPKQKYSK